MSSLFVLFDVCSFRRRKVGRKVMRQLRDFQHTSVSFGTSFSVNQFPLVVASGSHGFKPNPETCLPGAKPEIVFILSVKL